MSTYLKLTYGVQEQNTALREALIFIGRRYGRLKHKEGEKDRAYLNAGIAHVAKRFGRFRKNAIRNMYRSHRIENSSNRMWKIHKEVFGKAFALIVQLLRECYPEDAEYVTELLIRLERDLPRHFVCENSNYSDVLIPAQKRIIGVNRENPNEDIARNCYRIYSQIERGDFPIYAQEERAHEKIYSC